MKKIQINLQCHIGQNMHEDDREKVTMSYGSEHEDDPDKLTMSHD